MAVVLEAVALRRDTSRRQENQQADHKSQVWLPEAKRAMDEEAGQKSGHRSGI
jgi:hypothetical protein